MPRISRMVVKNQIAVYHVMSRTALEGFPLEAYEKDFLLDTIKRMAGMFFTEVYGFALMGNHFHLLVKMIPEDRFSDEDVKGRLIRYYGKKKAPADDGQLPMIRQKLANLSEFVREIKVNFARFYNKRHGRRGYFWGDRFKSVIVERGETLINCLAYIDLNPVRAGIVDKPEDYRWNSLGYHIQTDNKDGFLSTDFGPVKSASLSRCELHRASPMKSASLSQGELHRARLKEFNITSEREQVRLYRKYVYETGAIPLSDKSHSKDKHRSISATTLTEERKRNFEISRADRFLYRTRYFTDSGIIGSREFVAGTYRQFKHLFQCRHEKKPKPVKGLEGVFSLKRLSEKI